MKISVTGGQMKQIDSDTIQRIGIPSLVLMERAALAVADAVTEHMGRRRPSVLCVCGAGNNGADGIAVGRILQGRGCAVAVCLVGNRTHETEENRLQRQIAERLEIPLLDAEELLATEGGYDVIVDAVFGVGLGREITGSYRSCIEHLQKLAARGAWVVAVDIPSGIHADTGAVMGVALPAAVTVTFGWAKTGHLHYPGRSFCGEVRVADIGFSEVSLARVGLDCRSLEREDLKRLPPRRADGNKGTFGKLLVIAGSRGMCGAAYLSALAAYRTSVGLVKVLTVPENRAVLQTQLPEAIVAEYDPARLDEGNGLIEQHCDWADAVVLGPGLGRESYVETLVERVLEHAYVPVVLDADGLNTVAQAPHLTRYFTENVILTPHIGEMSRLTGMTAAEIKENAVETARQYAARTGADCVLKDAATVIADKDGGTYINTSGCSAMAKGGSGDVLTGVLGALLAQSAENGLDCAEVAAFAVYLHGCAGERAAGRRGDVGVLAHELAEEVPLVLKDAAKGSREAADENL